MTDDSSPARLSGCSFTSRRSPMLSSSPAPAWPTGPANRSGPPASASKATRSRQVGDFRPKPGERVVDGRGLVLAPGFIDIHNHSTDELLTQPLAPTQVSQGITTVVQGPDGGSPWPIGDYLRKLRAAPPAVNVMTMVGHATVRELVLGEDYKRVATDGRGREDGGPRRTGHARRRRRPFLGPRVRGRQLQRHARAHHDVRGGGSLRRLLHDAHARRGRPGMEAFARGDRDRPEGGSSGPDLPHQDGSRRHVGPGSRGRGPLRRGAARAGSTSWPTAIRTRPGTRT